jgi:hypothetical protein
MKKCVAVAAIAALLICLAIPAVAGGNEDELKVIKRAVKGRMDGPPEKSVMWFKVLILDNESGRQVFKVTLPIVIVRCLAKASKNTPMHTNRCDIDLAVVLHELEELSPLTLLEIVDEDSIVKIWLE